MSAHRSAQYSLVLRLEIADRPGMFARVAAALGDNDASIGSIDLVDIRDDVLLRDVTVEVTSSDDWPRISAALEAIDGVHVVDTTDRTFMLHTGGKIEQTNKVPVKSRAALSMAYTPGVARVCEAIALDPEKAFQYTIKRNSVAVVSDGTAVLGMGDIGPYAAMPVMEGKAMLFKEFAGINGYPICLDTKDPDEIVETVIRIAPAFGGINLEDISAPRCFEVEDRLKAALDIPVFHDDQHGTAIVTLAALLNACKVTGKNLADLRVLVIGLGAAGVAVSKILMNAGVTNIVGADSRGVVSTDRADYQDGSMPETKRWYAEASNPEGLNGTPAEVIDGMDLLVGVSGAKIFPAEALARMNKDAMVFAMANPTPEVSPEEAAPYVRIMATGRSDFPNQINNVLAFPGIFRGALDVRARQISEEMKTAAAYAIAGCVSDAELREDYIIPSVFNPDVAPAVASAVAEQARIAGEDRSGDTIGFAASDVENLRNV